MRKFVVTAAALGFAAFSAPAFASDTVTVAVPYSDLDLTSTAGQDALETRISSAIRAVCAKPDIRNLKGMTAWTRCRTDARESAESQIERSFELATL